MQPPRLAALVILFFSLAPARAEESLKARVDALIAAPPYRQARWGVLVVDSASGDVVYAHNPGQMFLPASTTKLYSCAAALAALGAEHRFTTPVYARGTVADGRLRGDLILVASGDLTFGGRTDAQGRCAFANSDHTYANGNATAELTATDPLAGLKDLARQVKASGIRQVSGEVLVDDRLFNRDRGSGSGPGLLTPILVNDNVVDVVVTPADKAGEPATVAIRPETGFVKMDAQVSTVAKGARLTVDLRSVGPQAFTVRGQIPVGHKPLVRIYPVEDPTAYARALFVEVLRREGVTVTASPLAAPAAELPADDAYAKLQRVAQHTSPPLHEAIKVTLKVSHNLYASTLPLLIGVKHGKKTLAEGLRLQRQYLADLGVPVDTVSFGGGAGGANADAVTPRATVDLLRAFQKRPEWKHYHDGFPVLGVDGTLHDVLPEGGPARGMAQAKTGTLFWQDVLNDRSLLTSKALAGVMTTAKGRALTFAMFVNHVPLPKGEQPLREGKALAQLCVLFHQHGP